MQNRAIKTLVLSAAVSLTAVSAGAGAVWAEEVNAEAVEAAAEESNVEEADAAAAEELNVEEMEAAGAAETGSGAVLLARAGALRQEKAPRIPRPQRRLPRRPGNHPRRRRERGRGVSEKTCKIFSLFLLHCPPGSGIVCTFSGDTRLPPVTIRSSL